MVLSLWADVGISAMIFENSRQCLEFFLIYAGVIAIPIVYLDIHVQPCAISCGKYLAGLKITLYLCRWKGEKKSGTRSRGVMTAHALLLAMDDFFRWIVNFFEQSLVRKVAVANFATIAERQIALPWRSRPYPPQTYPSAQEWADSLWAGPDESDSPCTTPGGVCLNFVAGCAIPCEQIGVRVLTRTLHRHRCPFSGVTLVDTIDIPTSYTPDSRQCQPPTGDCADLEISENFVIFM